MTAAALTGLRLSTAAGAASRSHTVVSGDTMWKPAEKYQVGTSETLRANPQVAAPGLICPGQTLAIPQAGSAVSSFEAEVVRLVSQAERPSPSPPARSCPGWPAASPRTWWTGATSPTPAPPTAPPSR